MFDITPGYRLSLGNYNWCQFVCPTNSTSLFCLYFTWQCFHCCFKGQQSWFTQLHSFWWNSNIYFFFNVWTNDQYIVMCEMETCLLPHLYLVMYIRYSKALSTANYIMPGLKLLRCVFFNAFQHLLTLILKNITSAHISEMKSLWSCVYCTPLLQLSSDSWF